jgi:formamidopyrimidine-DNA glycosylase
MPELPEVETIRLQLNTVLPGLVIKEIEILREKCFQGDKKEVIGKEVIGVERYGKMLFVKLNSNIGLAIHLKMTGRLIFQDRNQLDDFLIEDKTLKTLPNKHTRLIIYFENKSRLYFNDLRIFGWIRIVDSVKREALSAKLGIEPFTKDFTLENFEKAIKAAKKAIKLVIMDQQILAGVGNIYANEALFCARINPQKSATKLNRQETEKLFTCINSVLKKAIKLHGFSDNDYLDAFGKKGEAQNHFLIYGKNKENCPVCGKEIKKIQFGGRGTYFCLQCQPK